MKKVLLFGVGVVQTALFAQTPITLTQADSPVNGLRIQSMNAINPTLDPGNAGANETLDFSASFSLSTTDTADFITTSLTSYAATFPNSNLTLIELPDSSITFLNVQSDKIEGVGMYMGMDMLPNKVLVPSTDPLTQLQYPATYNNSFNDEGIFQSPSIYFPFGIPDGIITGADTAYIDSVKAQISITRESIIDAWGTITTPYGVFPYIRQNSYDITHTVPDFYITVVYFGQANSLWASESPVPITLPGTENLYDTTRNFFYYTNASGANGVSLIAEASQNNLGVITEAKCSRIYNPAGIIETAESLIHEIYPNPVKEILSINALNNDNSIRIYTSNGELIYSSDLTTSTIQIPVKNYKSGTYFVEVLSEGKRSVNKFIKE